MGIRALTQLPPFDCCCCLQPLHSCFRRSRVFQPGKRPTLAYFLRLQCPILTQLTSARSAHCAALTRHVRMAGPGAGRQLCTVWSKRAGLAPPRPQVLHRLANRPAILTSISQSRAHDLSPLTHPTLAPPITRSRTHSSMRRPSLPPRLGAGTGTAWLRSTPRTPSSIWRHRPPSPRSAPRRGATTWWR